MKWFSYHRRSVHQSNHQIPLALRVAIRQMRRLRPTEGGLREVGSSSPGIPLRANNHLGMILFCIVLPLRIDDDMTEGKQSVSHNCSISKIWISSSATQKEFFFDDWF
jgi:hypothetical protein